jgi:three-Cys-motif partner protein
MPKSHYDWSNGPAEIEPHSLAKHTILREYVERYVDILMRSGGIPEQRITLIDGFAGGGEYVEKGSGGKVHDGSPPILINAVRAATEKINAGRKKPVNVDADFIFVEKERSAFDYLEATLRKRFDEGFLDRKVKTIHGAFEDEVEGIVKRLKSATGRKPRPIFVLDQYGYSSIPFDLIAGLMQKFPKPEVFLTLAVDHIQAYAPSLEGARRLLRATLRVPQAVDDFITGKRAFEEVDTLGDGDRSTIMRYIQCVLHEGFAKHAGARCYTPFFITSKGSRRSYWFLHLANDSKANDVVKELHWQVANHFQHHGRPGTGMLTLGFDPAKHTGQLSLFDFGDSARDRTVNTLIEELPRILQEKYERGVTLKDLYGDLCNETPASMKILGTTLNELCRIGELTKEGAGGEVREPTTVMKDDDIIRPTAHRLLFSIPQLRGRGSQ